MPLSRRMAEMTHLGEKNQQFQRLPKNKLVAQELLTMETSTSGTLRSHDKDS